MNAEQLIDQVCGGADVVDLINERMRRTTMRMIPRPPGIDVVPINTRDIDIMLAFVKLAHKRGPNAMIRILNRARVGGGRAYDNLIDMIESFLKQLQ